MKKKPITFFLSLIFLFLFSGSVYGDESFESSHLYTDTGNSKYDIDDGDG